MSDNLDAAQLFTAPVEEDHGLYSQFPNSLDWMTRALGNNLVEFLKECSSAKKLLSFWDWGTKYDWLVRMVDDQCWSKSFNSWLMFFFHFNSWRRFKHATFGFLHLGSDRLSFVLK